MSENNENMSVIRYQPPDSRTGRQLNKNATKNNEHNENNNVVKKYICTKYSIIPASIILPLCLVGVAIFLIIRYWPEHPPIDEPIAEETTPTSFLNILPSYIVANGPLEMQIEYKIKTNVNDLKRIYINQKYYEYIKIDGFLTENIVDRKTVYDIFVIEKNEASDEAKYFYNYTYLCALTISSECVSSKDEYCIPKKLVDFNDQDKSNMRNLKEINDYENFPMPLCFFNLTDNNVINSIACHKKLNVSKINSIVLDLYFFRPPGIKRIDKKKTNITITTKNIGNNTIVIEKNGGICDINDPIGSFCSTDMNTTKDSEGNLIGYDEIAFTNITHNENNYYIKNKITKLVDQSNYLSELNSEKFNETLNKLYPKLKEHLKYYEQFSFDNYNDLYNVSKGLTNESQAKRRLTDENQAIINERNLFYFSHYGGVNIQINLKNNVGYLTEAMEASNFLLIDDKKCDLAAIPQFTDIEKIIKKLINLSKAGNNLATILYNKIKENLNNITDIININIPSMNILLAYKELSDIFDSTFSIKEIKLLPISVIEESDYLINKLEEIYNAIDNGFLKKNFVILNDYIYEYIKQSHILVNTIANNLNELGKLINSPKQVISDISNYYLNHTSTSYIKAIKEAQKILLNYYENEKELIVPLVDELMEKFENVTIESIQKQINLINYLIDKLDKNELSIGNPSLNPDNSEFKKLIANLQNSNNYINNIINLFKTKISNEMNLKNGYFISQYDITSNYEKFNRIINDALLIAEKLEDNEYVDKLFDEIMTKFRQSFIDITKNMEIQRDENFIPDEITLKDYFKISDQKNISEELRTLGVQIISKIKTENNLYLDTVDNVINEFLRNNKDYLIKLINEIDILFSTDSLNELAKSYEKAFNRHFAKIDNITEINKKLAFEYINGMHALMSNDSNVIEVLKNYSEGKDYNSNIAYLYSIFCKTDDLKREIHCINNTFFTDTINSRTPSIYFFKKSDKFKEKFDKSKEFIKSDLHFNILDEYKNYITQLKKILQTFKNNKISDKYPDYTNLYFIDNHIKYIDIINNRLNRYISDDIFNNYYIPRIDDYKLNQTKEIDNITQHIENINKELYVKTPASNKDFCTKFMRKRTFTCRNGAICDFEISKDECFNSEGSNNLESMVDISFNNDIIFEEQFNSFFSSVKIKIESYNYLIAHLKENISSIEEQILKKNITNNYLDLIEDKINNILLEKYSNNLIRGAYEYYKKIIDMRLENMLNNVSTQWITSFDDLRINVSDNLNNFTHSMNEFGIMALIYEAVISQNLTKIFYDSIIKHQKSEFNYTISYYYNSLLQNITSVYQYIFNQIPTNQEGFNSIINMRKNEVEEKFNKIFKTVKDSKMDSLSINKQLYVLKISSSNFFDSDLMFAKINKETSTILKSKGNTIYKLKNGKKNDEYSLSCRFYLENSLNGLQIEEYYKPVNEHDSLFIDLNTNKFIELISNNKIFDQDDFINQLNISIYNSNLEIKNDFSIKKEKYSEQLENEITQYQFSKENISTKINEQYTLNIDLNNTDEKKNNITENIHEILNLIKNHLVEERQRISTTGVSLTNDFSAINNTIREYKREIIDKLTNIIKKIVDNFHEKLKKEGYDDIIESGLNKYLEKSKEYLSNTKTYETLNNSFNIGEVIYDKVNEFVEEYKNFTKIQLDFTHDEIIKKLMKELGIEEILSIINEDIDSEYSKLLNILESKTKDINSPTIGYTDYDLNEDIKNDIEAKIEEVFKNIKNILNEIKLYSDDDDIELMGWENLNFCYDDVDITTFDVINSDFEVFITKKISTEKSNLNILIKSALRKNFNDLITNFVLSFGKDYFERIINYNENFKISNLYQNLKYSLVISLNYYQMLYQSVKALNSLTSDLKIKLYKFNNLDKITEQENKIILNILNDKVDEFIEKTKLHILNDYKAYISSDTSIKLAFNDNIQKIIGNNIEDISSDLEKDYVNLLNETFKIKIHNSYNKTLNDLTSDMIQTIDRLKENIKSLFDDLFSLEIDKVLNQTNTQMNITLNVIEEYNNYFNSFKLPEELVEYSLNFGTDIIKPSYEKLESFINQETRLLTLNNIKEKSLEYENSYKKEQLIKEINKVSSSFSNNYNLIINAIDSYGNNDYPNILQNEINRIDRRVRRRLNNEDSEEDKEEEYKEKIADKSIDENFKKLLKISSNTKAFIQTYEYFDKFIETIEKNKKKLNLSYKEAQQAINDSFKEEDIYEEIKDNLNYLYNISLNYYNEIKDNFYSLRNYTESSLIEIDDLLNECANITYKTFADKYEEISKEGESFDNQIDETENEIPIESVISTSQNNEYITEGNIIALIKKARFKFSIVLEGEEGEVKKPKIMAVVSNEIKPKQVNLKISNKFGECGENYQTIDVEFNKVNYTNILNFDTQSTLINIKTITDFDDYIYTYARYKIEDSEINECASTEGISICIEDCAEYELEIVEHPKNKKIGKIYEEESKMLID